MAVALTFDKDDSEIALNNAKEKIKLISDC
jgi:hypothetical protein